MLLRFCLETAAICSDIKPRQYINYILLPLNCCAAKTAAIGHFMTAAISIIYSTSERNGQAE